MFWFWLAGALLCLIGPGRELCVSSACSRGTLPASERLHWRRLPEIAGKLGVRRVARPALLSSAATPLLWCAGSPADDRVAGVGLLESYDEQQAAMILAHELAHLRRRDHWVRASS